MDGEGLFRGDRIIELNGKLVTSRTKDELQKLLNSDKNGKSQIVVLRKKSNSFPQQQLIQSQEDNVRLQHRISYLEDQVKELQQLKDNINNGSYEVLNEKNESHITSINISSPPSTPPEKPQIYQRGNFVTTIVGGKPIDHLPPTPIVNGNTNQNHSNNKNHNHSPKNHHNNNNNHITKTIIKETKKIKDYYMSEDDNHFGKKIFPSSTPVSVNNDFISKLSRRDLQRHLNGSRELNNSDMIHNNNYKNSTHHARSVEHLNYNNVNNR